MRITDRPPNTSVWNKQQGWTAEAFPELQAHETALTVQAQSGLSQHKLEELLDEAGFTSHYYQLGKNEVSKSRGTMLLYLIGAYTDYASLLDGIAKLQAVGIPFSAICVITPRMIEALTT